MIDKLLFNGRLVVPDGPLAADCVAISNGRILAVGNHDELNQFCCSKTERFDLEGATLIPGLVDAHIHWSWTALILEQADLMDLTSLSACLDVVAQFVSNVPEGTWVRGRGWSQSAWKDTGGAFPTAADLDRVAPNHPMVLSSRCGHARWANSLAMKLAGVGPSTQDPEGGSIQRDGKGNPTGVFFESAMDLIEEVAPPPTVEEIARLMEKAQELAWSQGLTGIHDYDRSEALRAMQILREKGRLGVRILKNINDPYIHHAQDLGLRWGFGDEWIRIGGLKMFSDGAIGSLTALMLEPYAEDPNNYGIRCMEPDVMRRFAMEATRQGIPSTIHAIGDLAMREVLDVLQSVREEEARLGIPRHARRHRIEHVQVIHPDDAHRLGELDIIASMQPIHATSDYPIADRYWGDRSALAYNPKVQLEAGARLAFGSDSPVEPFDPLVGIYAAVTRRRLDGSPGPEGWYPEARISTADAFRAYTEGPAWAAGLENCSGSIKPGYLADLVALDKNLLEVPGDDIPKIKVLGTMVGGDWRWGHWAGE